MTRCDWYVCQAVQYVCTLGLGLSATQARAYLADPAFRLAEVAVEVALMADDVAATKRMCQAWMQAARVARAHIGQGETL